MSECCPMMPVSKVFQQMKQAAEAAATGATYSAYSSKVTVGMSVQPNGAEASPGVAVHSKPPVAAAANVSAESSPFLGSQNTGDNDEIDEEEESNSTPVVSCAYGGDQVTIRFRTSR